MIEYRLVSDLQADRGIEAAFHWYKNEQTGLGLELLDELCTCCDRIVESPRRYQELGSGIRRTLPDTFRMLPDFAIEGTT